jgi:hypothetical protein
MLDVFSDFFTRFLFQSASVFLSKFVLRDRFSLLFAFAQV